MLALKMLLTVAGALFFAVALAIPLYGLWLRLKSMRKKAGADGTTDETLVELKPILWRRSAVLAVLGCVPLLFAASIVVVPSGMGGVRISQIRGTLPGTLYPGVHFVAPLVDSVQTFDLRDRLYTAGISEQGAKKTPATTGLNVQSPAGIEGPLWMAGWRPALRYPCRELSGALSCYERLKPLV